MLCHFGDQPIGPDFRSSAWGKIRSFYCPAMSFPAAGPYRGPSSQQQVPQFGLPQRLHPRKMLACGVSTPLVRRRLPKTRRIRLQPEETWGAGWGRDDRRRLRSRSLWSKWLRAAGSCTKLAAGELAGGRDHVQCRELGQCAHGA